MIDELSLEKYTKTILESQGIILKKSLGQNFLINQNIIDRIIEVSNVNKNDIILEIGPGIGALTNDLLKRAKHVIAVEIDKKFINILNENFNKYDNFTLINEDVLKLDIDKVINDIVERLLNEENNFGEKEKEKNKFNEQKYNIKVVANLPYYISSQVLINLIKSKKIEEIYIMLQKELGERFLAKTGTRDSGSITYYISYFTDVKKEINISKNNFKPVPKIDSQVLSFKKRKYFKDAKNEELLFLLIKIGFKQRRKTFLNNIKNFEKEEKKQNKTKDKYIANKEKITIKKIEQIFDKLNLAKNLRAEEINLESYIDITNLL